jgi:hypothetical protein
VDELRILVVHLVEKTLPVVPAVNAGEVGCASRSKSSVMEAQAPVSDLGSSLRSRWPLPDCSLEALRSLAMDFLAKVRAVVDRVIFFGLGLKVDASSDIRRRMGWVFSRLGLKPKILFGLKLRGRRKTSGLSMLPNPLVVVSRIKSNAGVVWIPNSVSGLGGGGGVIEEGADGESDRV